jgi:organic hydroperoxide reductase OsmC/OhrA
VTEARVHPYPHHYVASASAKASGSVAVNSPGLPTIETAPPPEFDGPGGIWSPETLLCASIADCLILTFRAMAAASKFEWSALECRVEGTLDRADGVTQFTAYTIHATLTIPPSADAAKGRQLVERSEQRCLVTNSLKGTKTLMAEVVRAA